MHPDDLTELGLEPGQVITIASRHDRIPSIVEADKTVRRKVVTMYHCFGGLVEEDDKFADLGSNVCRLTPSDIEYDPISGIPRMSNIAVAILTGWRAPASKPHTRGSAPERRLSCRSAGARHGL
jgi:anaerobic selenocysteine-containing dehydrogenase